MDGVKGALASKGVWGGILAFIAPVAGYFLHVSVTDIDVQQLADAIAGIVAAVGGVMAIVGRILATKKIA